MKTTCPNCASSNYFGVLPGGAVAPCFECGYSSLVGERSIPQLTTIPAMGQSSGNLSGKETQFTEDLSGLLPAAILSNSMVLKEAAASIVEQTTEYAPPPK